MSEHEEYLRKLATRGPVPTRVLIPTAAWAVAEIDRLRGREAGGEKSIDDIRDDLVEVWHDANGIDGIELHQFLGCTEAEYGAWFGPDPKPLPERVHGYWRWLHARAYPAPEVVCPSCATHIRARMADEPDAGAVKDENLLDDPCPKCGAKIRAKWSGVECSVCDWWFCY